MTISEITAGKFVDRRFAKSEMYKKVTEEIEKAAVCPFCPKHFKWHTKPILRREGTWFITENFQPYKNTRHHFVVIGKQHKENFSELRSRDWIAITKLINWTVKKFSINGGGIALRFGDSLYTGATVRHIHLHLIVPNLKKGKAQPVFFPFG